MKSSRPVHTTPLKPDIYVKEIPPARGNVETVIFLFDTPADPAIYSWHATWYAEHQEESTLCFYASPFQDRMVGPGIGQSRYGGALFLFPPRPIPNIWDDPALRFAIVVRNAFLAFRISLGLLLANELGEDFFRLCFVHRARRFATGRKPQVAVRPQ